MARSILYSDPTPEGDWVKAGDFCYSQAGMNGMVLRVMPRQSGTDVRVLWENGHEGVCSITTIRKSSVHSPEGQMNKALDAVVDRFTALDILGDHPFDTLSDATRQDLMVMQVAVRERIGELRITSS